MDVTDDGNGRLVDRNGSLVALVNYLSGGLQLWDYDFKLPYRFSYYCNPNAIPPSPVEIRLVSTPIKPVVHRVKANAKIKGLRGTA